MAAVISRWVGAVPVVLVGLVWGCEPKVRPLGAQRSDAGAVGFANEPGVPDGAAFDGGSQPVGCSGCFIAGECEAARAINPANPCQVCDPLRSSEQWSNNDGAACDDALFCTTVDACAAGRCVGTPRVCDDSVACNGVSTCDEGADTCTVSTNLCAAGFVCDTGSALCASTCNGCLSDGVCFPDGFVSPGNSCLVCEPSRSTTALSPATGSNCGATPSECSAQDTCDDSGQCQPNHRPVNTPCGSPQSATCNQSDACDGSGNCQPRLATNGTTCDDGAFCTVGDRCQGGECVPTANRDCGGGLTCDEVANQCVRVLQQAGAPCVVNSDCTSDSCGRWFRDLDGDGHGDPQQAMRTCNGSAGAAPPPGFTATGDDCCDSTLTVAGSIFPGQARFFAAPQLACPGIDPFDYDCSGTIEDPLTRPGNGGCGADCSGNTWITIPACGAAGAEVICTLEASPVGPPPCGLRFLGGAPPMTTRTCH
jgi:hypothetical protein